MDKEKRAIYICFWIASLTSLYIMSEINDTINKIIFLISIFFWGLLYVSIRKLYKYRNCGITKKELEELKT